MSGCGGGTSAGDGHETQTVETISNEEDSTEEITEEDGLDREEAIFTEESLPTAEYTGHDQESEEVSSKDSVFVMNEEGGFISSEFHDSVYHEDLAEGDSGVKIDHSAAEEGYIGVSAVSSSKLKFQVLKGEDTYTYDLSSDGEPSIFPLQCGDGEYLLRVMENVVDKKYAELYSTTISVELLDEFQPFLRPSDYSDYSIDSKCVKKAQELASKASDSIDFISSVYELVCSTVSYDKEKAANMKAGYLPVPDETLSTGKGICFDYASLAAAMMRSQGIPVKIVFGYVAPNDIYHAWNMFYTRETGWITVSFEVKSDVWTRLDLTFSANGANADFIGDGSNYADVYYY